MLGCDGGRTWIASPHQPGRTAAEWLVHGGRMPGDVVLEIDGKATHDVSSLLAQIAGKVGDAGRAERRDRKIRLAAGEID